MMRVLCIMAMIAAIGIAFAGVAHTPVDYSGLTLLCTAFLSAAMGGKVMQKRIEVNGAKTDSTVDMGANKDDPQ